MAENALRRSSKLHYSNHSFTSHSSSSLESISLEYEFTTSMSSFPKTPTPTKRMAMTSARPTAYEPSLEAMDTLNNSNENINIMPICRYRPMRPPPLTPIRESNSRATSTYTQRNSLPQLIQGSTSNMNNNTPNQESFSRLIISSPSLIPHLPPRPPMSSSKSRLIFPTQTQASGRQNNQISGSKRIVTGCPPKQPDYSGEVNSSLVSNTPPLGASFNSNTTPVSTPGPIQHINQNSSTPSYFQIPSTPTPPHMASTSFLPPQQSTPNPIHICQSHANFQQHHSPVQHLIQGSSPYSTPYLNQTHLPMNHNHQHSQHLYYNHNTPVQNSNFQPPLELYHLHAHHYQNLHPNLHDQSNLLSHSYSPFQTAVSNVLSNGEFFADPGFGHGHLGVSYNSPNQWGWPNVAYHPPHHGYGLNCNSGYGFNGNSFASNSFSWY